MDILTPQVPEDRLYENFRLLSHKTHSAAARLLQEVAASYTDEDGNFVKDFQTTGFDGRLWELYLHAAMQELGFRSLPGAIPDYLLEKDGKQVGIEATTVNASRRENTEQPVGTVDTRKDDREERLAFLHRMRNVYPIKFGSPLFSKLRKTFKGGLRYWEREEVKECPFVLAIADFHSPGSMMWTSPALPQYLYGRCWHWSRGRLGELVVKPEVLQTHRDGSKEIPSGFFEQPDSEHVSAVLFSSSATLSKFNRLGFERGYGDAGVTLMRAADMFDHSPESSQPRRLVYRVGTEDRSAETWREGLSMFHNPRALRPVSKELFHDISHHHLDEDGRMVSAVAEVHPMSEMTVVLNSDASPDTTPLPPVSANIQRMMDGLPPV